MALSEYRINPAVRVSRASSRSRPQLRASHHNLVISHDGQSVASTQARTPGQTRELITDFAPGTYAMASTILSDQALGQYGTLKATG